jgi:hypothetical protein
MVIRGKRACQCEPKINGISAAADDNATGQAYGKSKVRMPAFCAADGE